MLDVISIFLGQIEADFLFRFLEIDEPKCDPAHPPTDWSFQLTSGYQLRPADFFLGFVSFAFGLFPDTTRGHHQTSVAGRNETNPSSIESSTGAGRNDIDE